MKSKYKASAIATAMTLLGSLTLAITSAAPANAGTWCSGVNISYFKGGTADSFSDILEKGAKQAAADTKLLQASELQSEIIKKKQEKD